MVRFICVFPVVLFTVSIGAARSARSVPTMNVSLPPCKFNVSPESTNYWMSVNELHNPDIIHYKIHLPPGYDIENKTNPGESIQPLIWTWTADRSFLHWPLDYGLLSFKLLQAKTFDVKYVNLNVTNKGNCSIDLNSVETNTSLAEAFLQMVQHQHTSTKIGIPRHERHLFCHLIFPSTKVSAWKRFIALYCSFPLATSMKAFRCLEISYDYRDQQYFISSDGFDVTGIWSLFNVVPYFLGVIIYMFFPITLFEICSWLSKDEKIQRQVNTDHYKRIDDDTDSDTETDNEHLEDWIILNATSPILLSDTVGYVVHPFATSLPRLKSRLVRFFAYCFIPALMIPQLYLYRDGVSYVRQGIKIKDLMERGSPSNFLGLLSYNTTLMTDCFVPCLGGPIGVLTIYFVLGFVLFVVPKSLKQVIENGIPKTRSWSPLFLGGDEIRRLSGFRSSTEPGFQNAANVCKCSVYMLGTKAFWSRVFQIQAQRFCLSSRIVAPLRYIVNILLMIVLLVEIVLCLLFYGFPLFGCMAISISGAMVSISYLELGQQRFGRLFRTVLLIIIYILVIAAWALVAYSMALIFLQVFLFVAQVIFFCFVAVFTYPSTSFGFLFFYVVILFYILSNAADFREEYHDLLNTAVEISIDLIHHGSDEDSRNSCLPMSSVSNNGEIESYPAPSCSSSIRYDELGNYQTIITTHEQERGIPKDLFFQLVDKHKPIHIQIMHLTVKFALLALFVKFGYDVTSRSMTGPTSEMSEVMHVIFVVVLGAVPKMVDLALFHANHGVSRDIEHRQIKQTIKKYWLNKVKCENFNSVKVTIDLDKRIEVEKR